mgnify:CR=1 FL=1
MDSKWGGAIVATLAGLGVWLSTRPKTLVKEAVKRPTMDDVGERQILEITEYLRWMKANPDLMQTQTGQTRYGDAGLDAALESMEDTLKKAQNWRNKWGKNNPNAEPLPPLEYKTWEEYMEEWSDDNYVDSQGNVILVPTSAGPFNTLFDWSGTMKNSTGHAMTVLKQRFPSGTETWKDEKAYEKIREIYQEDETINAPRKEGGLEGMRLQDMGLELWNEQKTYAGRNLMKNKGVGLGYDIDAAIRFMDAFFIINTWKGFKMERTAKKEINDWFRQHRKDPFHRYKGNFEWRNADWKKGDESYATGDATGYLPIELGNAEAVYAPKNYDTTWKTDLLIRLRTDIGDLGRKGRVIMGGIQVKPLSFFAMRDKVFKQQVKHDILGGKAYHWKRMNIHPTQNYDIKYPKNWFAHKGKMEKVEKVEYGNVVGYHTPENHFYVQNLVYQDEGFLNLDSVMERIQWNIPDYTTQREYREKVNEIRDKVSQLPIDERKDEFKRLMREVFEKDEKEWTDKVVAQSKLAHQGKISWDKLNISDWRNQKNVIHTPFYRPSQ